MSILRAQHSLHDKSGLPEDVYVNTWYFDCVGGAGSDETNGIWSLLAGFYAGGSGAAKIASYLSPQLSGAYDLKIYDMADPLPRSPIASYASDYGTMGSGSGVGLPSEVAVCMSYSAAPVAGVPAGRLRGRLYLGPIDLEVNSGSSTTTSNIAPAFQSAIISQAQAVASAGKVYADDIIWCMYSPTRGAASHITKVWVDDAWDIQRRRGQKAQARSSGVIS